jgi:hypothetical protein
MQIKHFAQKLRKVRRMRTENFGQFIKQQLEQPVAQIEFDKEKPHI